MIDWTTEWPIIQRIAADYAIDAMFVAAIRSAENGAPGREFGVLSEAAPTYDAQCHIACATVRSHIVSVLFNPLVLAQGPKVKRLMYSATWIKVFARAWAPPDVTNDPTDLNQNWFNNASRAYGRFVTAGTVV